MKPAKRLPYGALVVYKGILDPQLCVVIGTFRYKRDGSGLEDCFGIRPETLDDGNGYLGYLLMSTTRGCIHSFWYDAENGQLKAV